MGFIRSSVITLGAIGFVASASVATAQVRPSDSLVSAQQAARTTPADRQGAKIEDANHISPALLLLILALLAAGGYALSEAISP